MIRITASLIALATLAACNTPNPPTVSASDVDRAFAEATAISNLPFTDTADLPAGSVTYTGQVGANVTGDARGSILGDMRMDVDFDDSDVGGSVTNINLIDPDGRPNQRFGGTLDIDGAESGGRINAIAEGDISAVDNQGFILEGNMLLRLDGDVYDDFGNGDAVFGTAKGDTVGDLELDVDGVFFGTAD